MFNDQYLGTSVCYCLQHIVPCIAAATAFVVLARPMELPQNLLAILAFALPNEAHIVPNLAPGISIQSYPLAFDKPISQNLRE